MKNGRLYDGNTLDEVYPRKRPARFYWQQGDPNVEAGSGSGISSGSGSGSGSGARPEVKK